MSARLGLGTMNFGKRTPEPEARRVIDLALASGVTDLDTANLYGDGESERIVGRALTGRRDQVRLTTKVGAWRQEGLSRARVVASLDESLARLGTDFVDVYLLHAPDPRTPLTETLEGVAEVLASGKAETWGVSNFAAWQVLELNALCDAGGLPRPAHAQVLYNVLVRQLEVEFLPFARRFPLEVTAFNPLAGGLLARDPGSPRPKSARLETNGLYQRRYGSPRLLELAQALAAIASGAGLSLAALAYGWLRGQAGVDTVLVGPASLAHLEAALAAWTGDLPDAVRAQVDAAWKAFVGTDASYAR